MKVAEKEELSNYKSFLIRRAFRVLSIKSLTLSLSLSVQASFPPSRDDKQSMCPAAFYYTKENNIICKFIILTVVNVDTMQAKNVCQDNFMFQKEDTSSIEKSRPPTGAPNAEATPAAAPAEIKLRLVKGI